MIDYEDDTHFCLKCHATILGLDNYVSHRKAGCSKTGGESPKSADEPFGLKAADFFSSLELQSSSKKADVQSTSGKNLSGILTRSKTANIYQPTSSREEIPQSKSGKNLWIAAHQESQERESIVNESKLVKEVDNLDRRKDDDVISDLSGDSEADDEDSEYEDDTSDDDDPQDQHTGGKWKPSSPINWSRPTNDNRGWNDPPPPSFTGGKWKPSPGKRNFSPPPGHTKGKWKPSFQPGPSRDSYDVPPPSFTGSKWTPSKIKQDSEVPPAHHTKGKWKPKCVPDYLSTELNESLMAPTSNETEKNTETKGISNDNREMILPSYTKGKWKPKETRREYHRITDDSPFRKSGGMVQYWCRPCNRRLASKVVYERHLKSELHFKRILRDKEFDDEGFNLPRIEGRVKRRVVPHSRLDSTEVQSKILKTKIRNRQKTYIYCQVCKNKVNRHFIGKHLISHYHCRNKDFSKPEAMNMALEYIYSIVLQSPFQCNICKFYCNTQEDFLNHWLSIEHHETQEAKPGYFLCSFCKSTAENNELMYNHLISKEHKDVLLVINRSVPVIIKKINPIVCKVCNESFTLNIQLLKHCERDGHDTSQVSRPSFQCDNCKLLFTSAVSLSRHKRKKHAENMYVCSYCDLTFTTIDDAKRHRNSGAHRYAMMKKCDICGESFDSLIKLKGHLQNKHPRHSVKCPKCIAEFVTFQEVTEHLNTNACLLDKDAEYTYRCTICPYGVNSKAEFLYHKALHNTPLACPAICEETPDRKLAPQYQCLICKKLFEKYTLLGHLRFHTGERPYQCSLCKTGFVRKSNWIWHVKKHEQRGDTREKPNEIAESKEWAKRPYLCSTCGSSFKRRSTLQQHIMIHTGKVWKCLHEGCIYVGRSAGELNRHMGVHTNLINFACDQCSYTGKTRQHLSRHKTVHDNEKKFKCSRCTFTCRFPHQLKRHARIHTGAKPFICPHCGHRCNNLENLRKHVLSTRKHPGKCIYECKFCTGDEHYQTNFAKEFKVHLIIQHADAFKTISDALSYIAGIYQVQDDATSIPTNVEAESDIENNGRTKETVPLKEVSGISKLKTETDPIVASSSDRQIPSTSRRIISTSITNAEQIFTAYTGEEDENEDGVIFIEYPADSWGLVGSYDVEDSGTLVNFQHEDESLFTESFE